MTKDRRQGVGVPGEGISLRGPGWVGSGGRGSPQRSWGVNQNPTRWIRNGGCWGGRLKGHGGESESYSVNQKWRVLRGSPQRSWGGEVRGQPGWGWWGQGSTRVNQNHQFPTTISVISDYGVNWNSLDKLKKGEEKCKQRRLKSIKLLKERKKTFMANEIDKTKQKCKNKQKIDQ